MTDVLGTALFIILTLGLVAATWINLVGKVNRDKWDADMRNAEWHDVWTEDDDA